MIAEEGSGEQRAASGVANQPARRSPLAARLFVLALLIRLAAVAFTTPAAMSFGDAYDYVETSQILCSLHVYPDRTNLPFFRAPGLPFFIAAVTACHPQSIVVIKIALAVCDAVTVVLIYLLGGSMIAGVVAAVNPFFIVSVCDVRSEPLFMMLLTAAIVFLLKDKPAWCGVAAALAALTRPVALVAIPLFALYRRRWMVVVAALLTLAPWTIRNGMHFHRLIVVNDAGPFNLWRGNHPEIRHLADERDPVRFAERSRRFDTTIVQQAHGDFTRLAIDELRADPAGIALWTLRKAWLYWRPWLDPREHSTKAVIASGVFNLALFIAGGIGIARSRHRRALTIYLIVMWIVQLPYQVVMRFRIPITDPIFVALCRRYADADKSDRSALL